VPGDVHHCKGGEGGEWWGGMGAWSRARLVGRAMSRRCAGGQARGRRARPRPPNLTLAQVAPVREDQLRRQHLPL
jgi:hypothetical protein